MASVSISCPSRSATDGVVRNGKSTAGHQRYLYGHEWRWMPGNSPHYGRWPQHDFTSLKKLRPQSVTSRIQPGSDVIVCAETAGITAQWSASSGV